ncbi:GGDEF domain-containing protein [Paraglaciecola hydrolytica]|uniref:diguanylate cyclase n=1 Tax=Paraglaciecola hydrolytica TaxID=1799789 RepID=A0A136A0C6_9ALTE|nr:GGDEF domain-containing protein [Paraglaciecola hydrolytica]KXI28709.1 histidine kinase [Paraglaciecola hydrolytica]
MDFFKEFLNGDFMPHGHCLLWREDLLLLHVGGDALTSIAYLLIPLALLKLVKARTDLHLDWMIMLFAGFIFFCGATHILGIINVWHGYYYIHGLIKTLTGVISIATAILLWRLLPQAIAHPSKQALTDKILQLQQAEQRLANANQTLEQEVAKRTAQLEKMANTDDLTGLLNRREIMRILSLEITRAERHNIPLSILMLDLDEFKQINDTYGHHAGDKLLIACAEQFRLTSRNIDFIGRLGGEEFLILLPDTNYEEAKPLAERCRMAIEKNLVVTDIPKGCTVSIGVVQWSLGMTLQQLINQADELLYKAKSNGRNCVY